MFNMGRQPATVESVRKIIQDDLAECDDKQLEVFKRYAIEAYLAPIHRYGKMDKVVVVARNGNEVIYWEDVEEGFNVSPTDIDGRILDHWCNQDNLGFALNAWIAERKETSPIRVGPAERIE